MSTRRIVALDSETFLFRAGVMAPELVCLTWMSPGEAPGIVHVKDPAAKAIVASWLEGDDLLVGHNVAYDLAVIGAQWPELVPLIFSKYDKDAITDTKLRQKLLDIAGGECRGRFVEKMAGPQGVVKGRWVKHGYSLDDLVYRCAGRRLDKDTWRLRYGELVDVPLRDWPEGARTYPLEDARATLEVFLSQEVHVQYVPDQFRQARAAWALHLTAVWGLRTHKAGVDKLEAETLAALAGVEDDLKAAGLVRPDGSRDTKAAAARMVDVCAKGGLTLRLTDGGAPSLDNDACEASGDELLEAYAELTSLKAVLNKDIPVLRAGTEFPVHTNYGLAASGRTTSSNPNVQNPRRLPGIRECFIPRPGKVFALADFSALELHTLAQVCVKLFGHSELADVLNSGRDPHTEFAASILGLSYEEAMAKKKAGDAALDDARQTAKVANFGFPGGLGVEKLCLFARKSYNVHLTEKRAKELKAAWIERWPEMDAFFRHVGTLSDMGGGEALVEQLFSNRLRGACSYTVACNSFFQGLGADAAKSATWEVAKACYVDSASVMYGSRIVNFVHDELIVETDDNPTAHDVAIELGRLMVLGANKFLPDVPARCEPLLARCWSKKSKPIVDESGRLVPWQP